jgi:hypothetical protein
VRACGSVVGRGTIRKAGRLRVRFPITALDYFSLPNPSSRSMDLGITQLLTGMITRNLPGGEGRPVRKVDNFTATSKPIV